MKILKSELQNGKIFVSAKVDGETRNYHFEPDRTGDEIREELEKCEATIKLEKEQWKKNKKQDELNEKASNTVNNLIQ